MFDVKEPLPSDEIRTWKSNYWVKFKNLINIKESSARSVTGYLGSMSAHCYNCYIGGQKKYGQWSFFNIKRFKHLSPAATWGLPKSDVA